MNSSVIVNSHGNVKFIRDYSRLFGIIRECDTANDRHMHRANEMCTCMTYTYMCMHAC